jgi:ribosomal protein S18 acetylase RimI-like enzyme
MIEIIIANNENEYQAAGILFKEYAAWLNIDLGFQHFEEELLHLKEMYSFPNGAIVLSKSENIFTGCVAVRKKENGIAELKRMFIKEEYRKEGIGALLLQKALEIAKKLYYKKIKLDTLDTMTPAINLYKKYGFYEIEPYYFNPEKNALFFEKIL